MLEMIVCRWCHKDTPEIGSFCMHCGRDPKPLRSMLWAGAKLEVADSADFHPLMAAILGEKQKGTPSPEAVRWALSRLSEKKAQVLIRLYGLDGGGGRKVQVICREVNVSDAAIYNSRNKGLQQLRHLTILQVLLGYNPVPK